MRIKVSHIENDFPVGELDHASWEKAQEINIENYWSGETAPTGRRFKAKLLWSDSALYVRFRANQNEPLIISETPNLETKTVGLWERDVCEIFIAPDIKEPESYYEFEIAPTGEWLDLKIHQVPENRETDWDYDSGMQSAARIESGKIVMTTRVEWQAFGVTPQEGDVWRGNLFRCVGSGATRGYLAWQPTKTAQPNFHVPEAFGNFKFIKSDERLKEKF
jgi:alpha-galactosidase